jgi:hypothetical protein
VNFQNGHIYNDVGRHFENPFMATYYILIEDGMNSLDARDVCFLKGKPPEFASFFNEISIFAISWQLHDPLIYHRTVFR